MYNIKINNNAYKRFIDDVSDGFLNSVMLKTYQESISDYYHNLTMLSWTSTNMYWKIYKFLNKEKKIIYQLCEDNGLEYNIFAIQNFEYEVILDGIIYSLPIFYKAHPIEIQTDKIPKHTEIILKEIKI